MQSLLSLPARRGRAHRALPSASRVMIAWTSEKDHETRARSVAEIELSGERTWVAALCADRCREVTLTAHVGNDATAKQHVLELAELLTFELAATQPLIRVRFAEPHLDATGAL